jgi:hypothetical protein
MHEMLTLRVHLDSPSVFWWGFRDAHLISFLCVFFCFVCLHAVSCVPNIANVYGLSIRDLAFQSFDWAYLMYAISDTRHEQSILNVSKLFTFIYSRANSVIIKQKKPTIILNLIHNILLQRQLPHNAFGPILLKVSNNIKQLSTFDNFII